MQWVSGKAASFLYGLLAGILLMVFLIGIYYLTVYLLQENVLQKLISNQTFLTVFSGVLVYTLGQVMKDFVLVPIQNFKLLLGQIDSKLIFHRELFYELMTVKRPKERTVDHKKILYQAQNAIKEIASNLVATYNTIPSKGLFYLLGVIRSKNSIYQGVNDLINLADLDYFSSKSELYAAGLSDEEVEDWNKKTYERNIRLINEIRGELGIPKIQHILPDGKIEYPLDDNYVIKINKAS